MASNNRTAKIEDLPDPGWNPGGQVGQYTIVRVLGQGGMGTVYEARHSSLKRRVALKTIRRERLDDTDAAERFRREMGVIGQLRHAHIVLAHDAGEIDGTLYLAMEFIDGENVAALLRSIHRLAIADACEIVRQAALGLEHAHEHGLIHRDVKPSNLLIDTHGQVKVADLGLARPGADDEHAEPLTIDGQAIGTVDYMSPEQIRGDTSIDLRTDLYSCGCTLFELLVGRPPFAGPHYKTRVSRLMAHQSATPEWPQELRPEVPTDLGEIVLRLLEKKPDRRPASAGELAELLAPFATGADLAKLMARLDRTGRLAADHANNPTPPGATFSTMEVEFPRPATTGRSASAPRPSATQASRRPLFALVSVLVIGTALLAIYFVLRPDPTTGQSVDGGAASTAVPAERRAAPVEPPCYQDLPPEQIRRLTWYPLLKCEPRRLIWPEDGGLSVWQHSADLDQVAVNTHFEALLSLGQVQGDRYRVEVDLGQVNWSGGIGVCWGLVELDDGNRSGYTFQSIRIVRVEQPSRVPKYVLKRSTEKRIRLPSPIPGGFGFESADGGRVDVPLPHSATARIDLHVDHGVLKEAHWAGMELRPLCESRVAAPQGQVGVWLEGADCLIRGARLMLE